MNGLQKFCWSFVGLLVMGLAMNARAQTTIEYVHTDALGSPVAVTNAAGVVIERTDYEPYGSAIGKPNYSGIGFTGHVQDGETGLTYMQQRYYDPMCGCFLSVDPVTAYDNGDMRFFNRYAYAANNPYKFTDPDGREIRFAKGSSADFLRNVAAAIRYLNGAGVARPIGEVALSKEVVTIQQAKDRTDATQTNFDAKTNTLTWADKGGLEVIDSRTLEKASISPALGLGHEFEHASNALFDINSMLRDANTFDRTYSNQEERNVIEEYERPAAEKLGEGVRDDHSGKPVKVECPTPECK